MDLGGVLQKNPDDAAPQPKALLFAVKASHAGIKCSYNKVKHTSPFMPLFFALMPVLPTVTNEGVLPYLLTPPYACTLKLAALL
jgi:hypothetical protein